MEMATENLESTDWWRNARTNYTYVAMAAGILFFLAYVTIWETFYGTTDKGESAMTTLGAIMLHMAYHLAIWIPFLILEIYAFRFFQPLDKRLNPQGKLDLRRQIVVIGCVGVCFLPLVIPAILIAWHA